MAKDPKRDELPIKPKQGPEQYAARQNKPLSAREYFKLYNQGQKRKFAEM